MLVETITIKDVKSTLAELSRTLRKSRKISRNDLADQINVSRITIQNLESGKNVTIDTVLKVLQHFEMLEKFNEFFSTEIKNQTYDSLY